MVYQTVKTLLIIASLSLIFSINALATELDKNPEVQAFISEMVNQHHFDKQQLEKVFAETRVQEKIIAAMSRPAEKTKPWFEYRNIFLQQNRIDQGVEFWKKHQDIINYAAEIYGVAPEIIVAIIGVETYYGRRQGTYRVMDALATLAFAYPPRAKFFRNELKHFLLMSKEDGFDPLSKKGSYAGAMGMGQFIPSSFRSYAVDFDGDGEKNIWTNPADAVGSVANYFKRHHWKKGQPVANIATVKDQAVARETGIKPDTTVADFALQGITTSETISQSTLAALLIFEQQDGMEYWLGYNNFYVISRYNHSSMYSMAVFQLSQKIKQAYTN